MCAVELMNDNQGFIMGVLTLVYVGATVFIWLSNRKMAKIAEKQLEEVERSQQQSVNIQLFEKRYELYSILNTWHIATRLAFGKTILNPSTGDILTPKKVFTQLLYQSPELFYFGGYYENVEEYLSQLNFTLQKAVEKIANADDDKDRKTAEDMQSIYSRTFIAVSEILNHTKNSKTRLELAKHIYSNIDINVITIFSTAFTNAACVISEFNISELEKAHKIFDEAEILTKMEEALNL